MPRKPKIIEGEVVRLAPVQEQEEIPATSPDEDQAQPVDVEALLNSAWASEQSIRLLQDDQRIKVLLAREAGASWASIGEAIGVDRTTAMRRFRSLEVGHRMPLTPGQESLLEPDAADVRRELALERAQL